MQTFQQYIDTATNNLTNKIVVLVACANNTWQPIRSLRALADKYNYLMDGLINLSQVYVPNVNLFHTDLW